jgi:Thioredoxin domain
VSLSTRLAVESDRITTDVIMVNLFPYLAVRYQAGDMPTTVVNGRTAVVGTVADAEYVGRLLAAA